MTDIDIPSLIERINTELDGVVLPDRRGQMLRESAAALQQQPQEIERLTAQLNSALDLAQEQGNVKASLRVRVREIEAERDKLILRAEAAERAAGALEKRAFAAEKFRAERDKWKDECAEWMTTAHNLDVDADAIRAKTVEECIAILRNTDETLKLGFLVEDLQEKFRALNQPPEAGEGGE